MMRRVLFISAVFLLTCSHVSSQEIIPFPDLSDHHDYSKNGGKSDDDRNYAIYSEYYQQSLMALDERADELVGIRKNETNQTEINRLNSELEAIQKKKLALLSEADLVEDLQKFY